MARSFSVYRRRPGLMDITVRSRPGVSGFRFKAASNFDAAFSLFQFVPSAGLIKPSLDTGMSDSQFRGLTRFLFNPSDYTGTVPAVDDTKPFWIRIAPVSLSGVVGPDEAIHLVLPFSSTPNRAYNIAGDVGLTSVELQLPLQSSNPIFEVPGSNSLFLAFDPNGYEFMVPNMGVDFSDYRAAFQTFSEIHVRGSAAPTKFYASFRLLSSPVM